MKKYLVAIILCVFNLMTSAQVGKYNLEYGMGVIFDVEESEPIAGVSSLEIQRNFARKEKSFWTTKLGAGCAYDFYYSDIEIIPYTKIGIQTNRSKDGKNFFHIGASLFLLYPEGELGYTFVSKNNKRGICRIYLSDIFIEGYHYIRLGVGYSFYSSKK